MRFAFRPLLALLLIAAAVGSAGCTHLYQVTFTHGSMITVRGQPKYDKATDTFSLTMMDGQMGKVPAMSIREITPASMANDISGKTQPFRTQPE